MLPSTSVMFNSRVCQFKHSRSFQCLYLKEAERKIKCLKDRIRVHADVHENKSVCRYFGYEVSTVFSAFCENICAVFGSDPDFLFWFVPLPFPTSSTVCIYPSDF